MAARSHLFPFRTEKLSSLSPMVLNFGRVGSRRFQESISLRLTPFFVSGRSASARKIRRRGCDNSFLRQLPAPQATIGDGRPGTMCHLRRQKRGCPGKKSRGITTEARRTPRRESLKPLRLCVEKDHCCLTVASGRRHERSVSNPG